MQALHGQVVRVSPVSDQYINPMDLKGPAGHIAGKPGKVRWYGGRKKDQEFHIMNSWSFFFRDLFFFTAPFAYI